jgi:hypothetical protein
VNNSNLEKINYLNLESKEKEERGVNENFYKRFDGDYNNTLNYDLACIFGDERSDFIMYLDFYNLSFANNFSALTNDIIFQDIKNGQYYMKISDTWIKVNYNKVLEKIDEVVINKFYDLNIEAKNVLKSKKAGIEDFDKFDKLINNIIDEWSNKKAMVECKKYIIDSIMILTYLDNYDFINNFLMEKNKEEKADKDKLFNKLSDEEIIKKFVNEKIIVTSNSKDEIKASILYDKFKEWLFINFNNEISIVTFGTIFKKFIKTYKIKQMVYFILM